MLTSSHHQIQLANNKQVDYTLVRSKKRRSIGLSIKQQKIKVNAPTGVAIDYIERFIIQKQSWLLRHLEKQAALPKNQMFFNDGDPFLLLGSSYRLYLAKQGTFAQHIDHEQKLVTFHIPHRVTKPTQYIKTKLMAFYHQQAESYIQQRFDYWQQLTGLNAKKLEFKVFQSRWGCCYANGVIKINPLLMAAPSWVIDCVLIHELCHLTHMNHSAKFWQLNKKFCDCCKESDQWLATHVNLLLMK